MPNSRAFLTALFAPLLRAFAPRKPFLGDQTRGPQPHRTRQAGVLKAVLRVLAAGPCPLDEVVAQAGGYTRAQVLAALRYAAKRGYVAFRSDGKWALLPCGIKPAGGLLSQRVPPQPGEWFPARLGVPRSVLTSDPSEGILAPEAPRYGVPQLTPEEQEALLRTQSEASNFIGYDNGEGDPE